MENSETVFCVRYARDHALHEGALAGGTRSFRATTNSAPRAARSGFKIFGEILTSEWVSAMGRTACDPDSHDPIACQTLVASRSGGRIQPNVFAQFPRRPRKPSLIPVPLSDAALRGIAEHAAARKTGLRHNAVSSRKRATCLRHGHERLPARSPKCRLQFFPEGRPPSAPSPIRRFGASASIPGIPVFRTAAMRSAVRRETLVSLASMWLRILHKPTTASCPYSFRFDCRAPARSPAPAPRRNDSRRAAPKRDPPAGETRS